MVTRIAHTFRIIRQASIRYPLMLASALVFLLAVQGLVDQAYGEQFLLVKIAFTASLGISLFFGMAMLGQRRGRVWLWNLVAAGFLAAFFFAVLPANEAHFTERYIYLLVPLYILSHLLVAIAPLSEKQRFWYYNKTLFINFFLTVVFTLVLAGGTQLALLAMNHLFNLGWDETLYVRVFLSIAILGSVFIFMLFHTDGLDQMEAPTPYPTVIQFFTQFILIPLLLLYAGILYIYGIKILLAWELPRGWVSYLVLAYGVLGILALLLVEPLLQEGTKKAWVEWFRRLFYYSMLPLLILLFTAIGTRIGKYGFTEARYYVLLLAMWLTFVSVYFTVTRRPALRVIPISLFIAGVAALILPFVNVFSVSLRSQKQAVMTLLQTNDLLRDGRIDTDRPVPVDVVDELQDKYTYLSQRQATEIIDRLLDPEEIARIDSSGWGVAKLFDTIVYGEGTGFRDYLTIQRASSSYDIAEFTVMLTIEHQEEVQAAIHGDTLLIRKVLYGENREFSLTANEQKLDLLPLIKDWAEIHMGKTGTVTVDQIVIPFRHGRYEGVMRLDHLNLTKQDEEVIYFFNRVDFLFR